MKVLLLTPPMTQLNTPYPATAYLTGFLRKNGWNTVQADPAIELVLELFSKHGLSRIQSELSKKGGKKRKKVDFSPMVSFFNKNSDQYIQIVDSVIHFLQGNDPSLALRIVSREFLPEGPRFMALQEGGLFESSDSVSLDPQAWAFGTLGIQDRAKYLASLFIDDLADLVREGIDSRFELSRYGEKLAASVPHFDFLDQALHSETTLVDRILQELVESLIQKHQPQVVGVTAPFPGNVYGAFRIAQKIKEIAPKTALILGGGYVNTELRELKEPRVFDYFDFVTVDDGERPFLCILEFLKGTRSRKNLLRTFLREDSKGEVSKVVFKSDSSLHDIPHRETGTPTYEGLPLQSYLSIFEMLNPMHRIWSDGRWNKLTLAHGCYWKKCNFCDVTLDYIGRYDPASADLIVNRMESLVQETGQRGFHFVDEAAPPAVLRAMAQRLIERNQVVTWWGNIRFEKAFTSELAQLLAKSGCIAVSGGLEVASNRLLQLMNKGVTVEQVARVTRALTDTGIMVHAYLMYGFPTQTELETVDALERVRQLFEAGCIQSAYWHRFSVTAHSPIGKNPAAFGIRIQPETQIQFARNDLSFTDPTGCDHDKMGEGLRKALYNYMHGVGLDLDVRIWFGKKGSKFLVPKTSVPSDLIQTALI